MKKYLFAAICFIAPMLNAQTLRDAVAVVRPNYTESTVEFLTDFSTSLRRDGYTEAANVLAAYSKGGYGTGFLWKNTETGRFYIITNRHVVAQAKDVNIEFMPVDAPEIKYANCPIVAVDESSEMALVALPSDASFDISLSFSQVTPADGNEVYTAGFPGLGGDPSWQLGKGIVSNSSARLRDWTVQKSAKIIQHTAQIDPGSSGGPLLVADNSPAGYSIIGINTWQARNRENANFAVAASTMQQFVAAHFAQTNPQSEANLQNRAQQFAQAVKEGYRSVYPYISDDYIGNISVNGFYELLNSLSDSVATEVGRCFGNGLPVDGVRIGMAEALSARFGKNTMTLNSVVNLSGNSAQALFGYGNRQITSDWTFSNGEWNMSNFSALNMRDMARSGVATSFGYKRALLAGFGSPANDMTHKYTTFSFEYTLGSFFLLGFDAGKGSLEAPYTYYKYSPKPAEIDTARTVSGVNVGAHIGLQFPIKLGSLYIIPNVKGYWGASLLDDPTGEEEIAPSLGHSFGVNAAYKLRRNTYLIAGLQKRSISFKGETLPGTEPRLMEFMVGITF